MSDYVEQNKVISKFSDSNSWVILSSVENSIKEKIEQYGTPLKEWDIQINYGIKTGCNEAFIIDENTKNILISEDPKSAEIIRPILRGRDIKRYSYEFQHLYMICTFPSLKINIDNYPAIKNYLLSFGKERLEQTGKEHIINGVKIKARKKTNNKWFETQDSIAYWDEFSKQKILYPCIMHDGPHFMLDTQKEYFTPAPGNIITGNNLEYLLGFLCSKITYYVLRQFYMGGGIEGELKTNRLLLLPIPKYTGSTSDLIISRCSSSLSQENKNNNSLFIDIENEVANHFNLTEEEKEYCLNYEFN